MSNSKVEATFHGRTKPVAPKLRDPERPRLIAGLVVGAVLFALDAVLVVWGVWGR
jgi:hypothetical protein